MEPTVVVLILIGVFLVAVILGVHISFALAAVGFIGMLLVLEPRAALRNLALVPYSSVRTEAFVAVPLFILMGQFAFRSGVASDFYYGVRGLFGRLPGGLGMATTAACAAFAACSASNLATAATFGKVCVPEMERYGYKKEYACGIVAASSTLGEMIPPSILMILVGVFTQQSIAQLFMAGLIPGILSAFMYMVMMGFRTWRNPALGPAIKGVSLRETIAALPRLWGILLIAVFVLGSIYGGLMTPTESGAGGAFIALLIGLLRRTLKFNDIKQALIETANATAMVFAIVIGAYLFASFVAVTGLPARLGGMIVTSAISGLGVIALWSLLYLFLGTFMSAFAILFLTVPILYPVMTSLGYDGIWFGVMAVKLIGMGYITPPYALNVFVIKGVVPDASLEGIFRNVGWFLFTDVFVLALLVAFPVISLWLPNLLKG